jgi:hypothetical protein
MTGCVATLHTVGPYGKFIGQGMNERAVAALPRDDREFRIIQTGSWELQIKGLSGGKTTSRVNGVIVLTPKALYLQQWSESQKALEVTKSIALNSIKSVEHKEVGPIQLFNRNCMPIVVVSADNDVNTIMLTNGDLYAECRGTRELLEGINKSRLYL